MHEQSKAARRRFGDGAFLTRYFVGDGLDIGAGPDGLSRMVGVFPGLRTVRDWDLADGDAQYLAGVEDASFDLVHSSHCLEHMVDARTALANWIRVVRPGGHLVITVPDEDMYERGIWPSRNNADHKWSFTAFKAESWSPKSVNLVDLARDFGEFVEVERLHVVRDFFRAEASGDQTMTLTTECAIELVLRRRDARLAPVRLCGGSDRGLIPPVGRNRLKACRHGLMLFSAYDTNVSRILDTYGEYAEQEIALFGQVLRPGDIAVDAGANIGALAVAMARMVGSTGQVHAFEPQEHVFRTLVANAALNEFDHLHVRQAAVGDEPGAIEVPRVDPGILHSFGSVALDSARRNDAASGNRGAIVPLITIDELQLPRCRLLKADVEGMEASVVRGARDTIARCRPLLYLEAEEENTVPVLLEELETVGYRAFWHVVPYCREDNFYGRPLEFFRGVVAINIVAAPPGFAVNGLRPVVSTSWRADLAVSSGPA